MLFRLTVVLLCLNVSVTYGQEKESPETFAQNQSKLFTESYNKRDTEGYNKLLGEWLNWYDQLSVEKQKQFSSYHINAYYNLSCTYALTGNKTKALEYFEKSLKAGYTNYSHIQEDTDLDILRKEPAFIALIEPLRATGDYLYILKKAAIYDPADQRQLPTFTYQAANTPELVALRAAFNLDSIAGEGNESSQVLNLLHWIHDLIPHDGNHENPVIKNAISMIAVCKKDNRGLNCRGLSTVLNECYLAMGFKSRLVTCLPKDSLGVDPDCHVINAVYLPSLKKWVWVDPTNDAYIMNEKGELLSIEEVRQRIIGDRPLIVNPTANWNHRQSTLKENYLFNYMAKNLYILQCPVNSAYDNETAAAGKTISYIQLNPLDYFKQKPDKKETFNKQRETTYIYYNTNNPAAFWQIP